MLRWGVLGAARIAGRAVLPAIAASSNGRLVALASRSKERAEAMLQPYRGARVVDSYEALLSDPHVDAVYIPLVNAEHRRWAIKALQSKKHVLCEKPLATTAREAEEMAATAEQAQCVLMEALMYRFHPGMVDFVRQLSEPIHVQAAFGFRLTDPNNYRLDPELGGGALLDVGCYTVSVARWVLGEPTEVRAALRVVQGVDVQVSALLEFAQGETADIWASIDSPEFQEMTVVTSSQVHRRERPFTAWHDPHDPYRLMVESFSDSVQMGLPAAIPLAESIANLRVMDRVREVAQLAAT